MNKTWVAQLKKIRPILAEHAIRGNNQSGESVFVCSLLESHCGTSDSFLLRNEIGSRISPHITVIAWLSANHRIFEGGNGDGPMASGDYYKVTAEYRLAWVDSLIAEFEQGA